ncbi:MAG: lipid-A-disaccharide synthase [Gemmatimonadota bacterium]|nr:lipid-A-disaccharide synthase [Gemmatimonadota bacterium]
MSDVSAGRSPPRGPAIFIAAGEPSGDLHGAALARALRERIPGVRLLGLGGSRMAAEGTELLATLDQLAVMGFSEVVRRLPFFLRLRRRVFQALEAEAVDLVIPIDYPGFNLRLARRARARGIPVLFYIAPQVWAWHASRVRLLARDADRVAVVLPFEQAFLRERGVDAHFVGHPLLDSGAADEGVADELTRHGVDRRRPILGLFPGSRPGEVRRHLPLFSAAAKLVVAALPAVQPVIGVLPDADTAAYPRTPWPRLVGGPGLLRVVSAAIVKSGTITLEGALAGTPMAVAYRMDALSYGIARRLVRVPHIALANLIADDRVVPELVQERATPEALARAILPLLSPDGEARTEMIAGLGRVRAALGAPGASGRVAEMACELLGRRV